MSLKAKFEKLEKLEAEAAVLKAELVSDLSGGTIAKPKAKAKPKKKTTQLATADGTPAAEGVDGTQPAADAPKRVSLKGIVQSILAKNPNGLDLGDIVTEVDGMVKRNEYSSNAKSLSAVVAQAVTALKQENVIVHDRESKKYSLPSVAA
jgi:hypothetical protein